MSKNNTIKYLLGHIDCYPTKLTEEQRRTLKARVKKREIIHFKFLMQYISKYIRINLGIEPTKKKRSSVIKKKIKNARGMEGRCHTKETRELLSKMKKEYYKTHDAPHSNFYTYNGKTMNITNWAKEVGIGYSCLSSRLGELGWDFEKAITTPVQKQNKKT